MSVFGASIAACSDAPVVTSLSLEIGGRLVLILFAGEGRRFLSDVGVSGVSGVPEWGDFTTGHKGGRIRRPSSRESGAPRLPTAQPGAGAGPLDRHHSAVQYFGSSFSVMPFIYECSWEQCTAITRVRTYLDLKSAVLVSE